MIKTITVWTQKDEAKFADISLTLPGFLDTRADQSLLEHTVNAADNTETFVRSWDTVEAAQEFLDFINSLPIPPLSTQLVNE